MEIKKHILFLLTFLVLTSCEKKDAPGVMVLNGQIEQGADSCEIQVYSLRDEALSPVTDAAVKVKLDGVFYSFSHVGGGVYRSEEIVNHLHDYALCHVEVSHPDFSECTADLEIPKSPGIPQGSYTYSVNSVYPESECFELIWPNEPGQNYFFELYYLGSDFEEIPFAGPSGLFEAQNGGPQMGHHLVVFNNDFRYYGPHRLVVKAVDERYLDAHYYIGSDELGLLEAGISNVKGGKGLITGSSREEILLEINP
ncbi:MAG: hypothetical protein ACOVOO_05170 [Flavobacteriales bacterium]